MSRKRYEHTWLMTWYVAPTKRIETTSIRGAYDISRKQEVGTIEALTISGSIADKTSDLRRGDCADIRWNFSKRTTVVLKIQLRFADATVRMCRNSNRNKGAMCKQRGSKLNISVPPAMSWPLFSGVDHRAIFNAPATINSFLETFC